MVFAAKALLAAGLLSGFAVVAVRAGDYCRCEADFERFYDRRRLLEGGRILATVNPDYYVNDDGYYVVDGITVLPNDSDQCSAHGGVTTRTANIALFFSSFGNHRGLLDKAYADDDQIIRKDEIEKVETDDEEHAVAAMRNLKGGSKSGSKKNYYYYGGKGKGKGKGKVRFVSRIFSCIYRLDKNLRCALFHLRVSCRAEVKGEARVVKVPMTTMEARCDQ